MTAPARRVENDPIFHAAGQVICGWITQLKADQGVLLVDFVGNEEGPVAARSLVVLDVEAARRAVADRSAVALLFERGDAQRPLILGFVHTQCVRPLAAATPQVGSTLPAEVQLPSTGTPEARLDGRSVVLEGQELVVLRCGEASLELHRDGRLIIHGVHVVTHAEGVNRIRGGSVQIN